MTAINVFNNYWAIGGSTSEVYSSATNTMVPVNDQTYVDWTAWFAPTPIASDAELAEVLQAHGLALPAWMFAASDTFIQPTPTTYTKGQLAAYSADARYRHASGGVVITSLSAVPFLTDPTSRNTVNSAYQYAVANPAHVSDWKMSDGSFIKLDLPQLTTLNDNMTVFVQACFSCESTNAANIRSGATTTLAEIDAAFAAISNVFP
jgi:hypothetical protein